MEKLSGLWSTNQHKVPGLPGSDLSAMHKFIPKETEHCWNPDQDKDQRSSPHCCSCLLNRHVKYYTIIDGFAPMFVILSSLTERWKVCISTVQELRLVLPKCKAYQQI